MEYPTFHFFGGKFECNTVEYTTAFLFSDWLLVMPCNILNTCDDGSFCSVVLVDRGYYGKQNWFLPYFVLVTCYLHKAFMFFF